MISQFADGGEGRLLLAGQPESTFMAVQIEQPDYSSKTTKKGRGGGGGRGWLAPLASFSSSAILCGAILVRMTSTRGPRPAAHADLVEEGAG